MRLTGFCPLVPCLYEFIHCTSPPSCFVPLVLVYRSPCEGEDCCEVREIPRQPPLSERGLCTPQGSDHSVLFNQQPWRLNVATKETTQKKDCRSPDCGFKIEEDQIECCACEAKRRGIAFVVVAAERRAAKSSPYTFEKPGW